MNDRFEKIIVNQLQKRLPNSNIRNNNNSNQDCKKNTIIFTNSYPQQQRKPLPYTSPLQMFYKVKQTKMLIMPLAIMLLSSTIVMATSNPISPPAAYAITFGSTKNLSNNDGDSFGPLIEASGNNVYTVWRDSSGGDTDTFFKRSATSGDSFQSTKDLSNGIDGDTRDQHIAKEGNNVYVVWDQDGDVYFKRSTNNGASFGSTINLSNDDTFSERPDIAVVGDNVYVVWDDASPDEQGDQQSQLFFKKSTNDGASFGSLKKLDIIRESLFPRIAASGSNVYIAVTGGSEDDEELFFTRSTNEGSSFSEFISINNNHEFARLGDIAAKGSNVYITWNDGVHGVSFIRSTNNGASFGDIREFGFGSEIQLDTVSSNVYVVWKTNFPDENIAFKASTDNGAHFGSTKDIK